MSENDYGFVRHTKDRHGEPALRLWPGTRGGTQDLEERLRAAQEECRALREQLADARRAIQEHAEQEAQLRYQTDDLANLYVASCRLHGNRTRQEVVDAIKEIVANLIGSEEILLFDVDWTNEELRLVDTNGIDPAPYRRIPLSAGLIGGAVRAATPIIIEKQPRGAGEEQLTAVIPLQLASTITGALAIFRLLPQKPAFQDIDRNMFDLLASQAAMALHSAELDERDRSPEEAPASAV
jgi:K+-sensing histidine kinase KdpD